MRKQEKGITLIALIITIVVLLILAMVAIDAIRDGGIITHAERAANQMNKAQIEQKANLTKLEFTAEALMNKDLKMSKQEFRDALRKAFEIPDDMDTNNDDYIEVNEKYAVHIKNTNLDVEVVEITNAMKLGSLVSITYEPIETRGESGVVYSDFKVKISQTMDENTYKDLVSKGASQAEKEVAVLQVLGSQYNGGQTFNNLDEAIVAVVNVEFAAQLGGMKFTDINTCLSGLSQALGTTVERENLYNAFFNGVAQITGRMEKDVFINQAYNNFCVNANGYLTEVNLSIIVDGKEKISTPTEIPIEFNLKDIIGVVSNNSTVELIIKNISNVEITREKIDIRNIIDDPTVLTEEEASGIWDIYYGGYIRRYKGSNTDVVIPTVIGNQKITKIYNNAFSDCTTIKTITIHEGITEIGSGAFEGCKNLESITIPNSVTTIGVDAFSECERLSSIILSNGITSIERGLFKKCKSLSNITIPENVTSIGYEAFKECKNLTSIEIPGKVTTIGTSAFSECTKLRNITIPNSVTSLGQNAFLLCTSLESVTLSENLESIASQTFDRCSSLTNVIIPEKVTTIETKVFWSCTNLSSVTILGNVTSIANDTFQYSNNLKNIYFKNSTWPSGQPWGATNATVSQLSQ